MSRALTSIALTCALLSNLAHAAGSLTENFDDVGGGTAALQTKGWIFRDQTSALGQWWWNSQWQLQAGWAGAPSHDGAGFLAFNGVSSLQGPTTVSSWAILPPVAGQVSGDVLSLYSRLTAYPQFSAGAQMELRYSPNGGSSTGSGALAVGDFTTVLTTVPVTTGTAYLNSTVTIPGSGRIAVRLFHPNLTLFGASASLQLDTLKFNPPPPPFPIPAAGATVTWTTAMNPIVIATDVVIPVGATVLVNPGVDIRIAEGKALELQGALIGTGTSASPIRFTQLGTNGEIRPVKGGRFEVAHAIVDAKIHPMHGARIVAADSSFLGHGSIENAFDAQLDPARSVMRLDRCTFQSASIRVDHLVAALRDVAFSGLSTNDDVLLLGYVLLDDVSVNGTALWLGKAEGLQPIFVDRVSVTNSGLHGGLYLYRGTNFLLGPNNQLVNDKWPVEFGTGGAGLLPGSVIPTGGNQQNFVMDTDDFDPQNTAIWAPLAVPYVVRIPRFLGYQTILPGTRVQFMPTAGWESEFAGGLDACGTEAQPIVFERFDPAQQWDSIRMFKPTHGQRLEHVIFRGAKRAVTSDDVQFDSCRFENCLEGIYTNAYAQARKCEFYGNTIAINAYNPTIGLDGSVLLSSPTNPNAFSGNGIAVRSSIGDYANQAAHNWWGHPMGPYHATLNPQGQGDPIDPIAPLPFQPFLTSAPDFSDSPPHVTWADGRIVVADPGTTLLLSWQATDDSAIVSQRVLFSSNGNAPGTLALVPTPIGSTQRTFAFTVPSVGISTNGVSAFLRIESVDDHGQIGSDDLELYITEPNLQGVPTLTVDPSGATFAPGDHLDLAYTMSGLGSQSPPTINAALYLDGDRTAVNLGSTGIGQPFSLGLTMPEVSTDRARFAFILQAGLNQQRTYFTEPFSIRPDAILGDAPPTITTTAPLPGQSFLAGSIVPIRWDASDDEGLRSFDILVSTDGARRWNVVALDLPGTARAFDWTLPPNVAFEDVEVRVIARDMRFQNSSDEVAFRIVAGTDCQTNLGYGSAGGPFLSICGSPLASGQAATLTLTGAPASQPGLLLLSLQSNPTPALGGILATLPVVATVPFATGTGGQISIAPIPGGGGPFTLYLQAIVAAPSIPSGAKLSNALKVTLLP